MTTNNGTKPTPSAIGAAAADACDGQKPGKPVRRPLLIVDNSNLPAVAAELSRHLANSDSLFERGELVKLFKRADGFSTVRVNANHIINEAHAICRPAIPKEDDDGEIGYQPITLPRSIANLYLNRHGEWGVRELGGICPAPILSSDGSIRTAQGYDPVTKLWCVGTDIPRIATRPSLRQAKDALHRLRKLFATFPFQDAVTVPQSPHGRSVDTSKPAALDESTFLTQLLTAVCRASLPFAPGLALHGVQLNGAGTGKGLLVNAIARIAYNVRPAGFTSSGEKAEFDKCLTTALVKAAPMISIDNANNQTVRSNLLAQVITENPVEIRPFHKNTEFVTVETRAFVEINGNAFRLSEDLVRRFLFVNLDAECENPEQRRFEQNFRMTVEERRHELLGAALTIWRWGRLNRLDRGTTLGSFEVWGEWCRDPLLALGCADPVGRIGDVKSEDPLRQQIAQFFSAWHARHGDQEIEVNQLDPALRELAGAHGRNRQGMADFVKTLHGVRLGGFVLTRVKTAKWSNAICRVTKTD